MKPRRSKRIRDKNVGLGLGKDLVSKLPDELLHEILSFLPTKDLVRTSVLSTRWRKVWTFFSVIDIDLNPANKMYLLRREMLIPPTGRKRMFLLNLSASTMADASVREMLFCSTTRISKFRINLEEPIVDASVVMLWVDKVMEHKVQELDISLPEQMLYRLPDRLFSYDSLMELKLSMDCELTVPNYVCFPRLKVLHLSWLKFSNARSTQRLFSSCPVLEELDLSECKWGRINSILIYIPSLKTMSIEYDYNPYADGNVPKTKIMISAPNLLSFNCKSDAPMDLVLCNQSSLEDASIEVSHPEFDNPESSLQRLLKLLHGIQGVKSLTLLSYTLETLLIEKDIHALLPSFDNLEHLELICLSMDVPRALMNFLQKTPNLHSLNMDEDFLPDGFTKKGLKEEIRNELKKYHGPATNCKIEIF